MLDPRLTFRDATAADAPVIARLHVAVWRRTYRDLAPAAAVEALDETRRRARWSQLLAAADPERIVILAEIDGALAGFAEAGRASAPEIGERWEIKHLYVDGGFARRGIGRALLGAAAARLAERDRRGVALGVVVGNAPALAFYTALGGRIVGRYADPGPLWRSDNLIVVWDDAADLAARCAGPRG